MKNCVIIIKQFFFFWFFCIAQNPGVTVLDTLFNTLKTYTDAWYGVYNVILSLYFDNKKMGNGQLL